MTAPEKPKSVDAHGGVRKPDDPSVRISPWAQPLGLHSARAGLPSYANSLSSPHITGRPVAGRDLRPYIEQACEQLVGRLGVYNMWIALTDEAQVKTVASSFHQGFEPLKDRLLGGFSTHCMQHAAATDGVFVVSVPRTECGDCPLAKSYEGRVGMAVRIGNNSTVHGIMCASVPDMMADDSELKDELAKAAGEIDREISVIKNREELIRSDELVHSIYRAVPVGIGLIMGRVIREVNDMLCIMTGYNRQALIGMPFDQLFVADPGFDAIKDWISLTIEREANGSTEARWRRCDGSTIAVRLGVSPLDFSDPAKGITFSVLDISTEKENAQKLMESRRLLSSLMDSLPGMAYRCRYDKDWTMEFVSKGVRELTGYAAEDMIHNRRITYEHIIHPEDRERIRREIEATKATIPFTLEYRIQRASGDVRWVWERGNVVPGAAPGEAMVEGFIIDITERKKLDEHIIQMRKNESLGAMAGGVAHDFNNILAAIVGNGELALALAGDQSEIRTYVKNMVEASDKAALLCRQLLYFCGSVRSGESAIDIGQTISEMQKLLSSAISSDVSIECALGEDVPPVNADSAEIKQIVIQLVINAAESYEGKHGVVSIATGSEYLDGRPIAHMVPSDQTPSGLYTWIKVSDHGCGMDEKIRAYMFDPFFSTKFTGRGMGLAAVNGIVATLKGFMVVVSSPGNGTTFKVYLPVMGNTSGPTIKYLATHPEPREFCDVQTVLLVDDDPVLRDVTKHILLREGITVLTATDGMEAVEVYTQHRQEIDMVLMDLTMPRMDGIDAAKRMRAIDPCVRIVISTGYSEEDISSRVDPGALDGVLLKPYSRADLMLYIRPSGKPA